MRCLVVDDEPLARAGMAAYVDRTEGLTLIAACASFRAAAAFIATGEVDLLLLDIELPGENGLQEYRALHKAPRVIFVTAFAEHALDGFEVQATDYLLKPVTYQRFLKAIELARERVPTDRTEEDLWLRSGTAQVRVRPSTIRIVEGMENYACLHTTNGRLVVLSTLHGLQEMLDAGHFIRVHRSFIVNIEHVRSFRYDRLVVGDRVVPIGRKYRHTVRALMGALPG